MKIKILGFVLLSVIALGCASPSYLPYHENLGTNTRGSLISINPNMGNGYFSGELIAIDSTSIYILGKKKGKEFMGIYKLENVKKFTLRYSKSGRYGWTIPVYTLSSIMHGWIGVITFPVNLFSTIAITISGQRQYTYNKSNILDFDETNERSLISNEWTELKKFARFPQGIPEGVNIAQLK